ncbi:MAG TPA: MliC family protein [Candidatus Paceibacterota bacterium]|nr:MliC family protein [Candidatus Paceibacterota bacterium]HOL54189.1 MliC family protein [Candidatus Paceibacterota bacterium]HPP17108.1 MliC family protein [Candidatus Paceibacterota bacterium]
MKTAYKIIIAILIVLIGLGMGLYAQKQRSISNEPENQSNLTLINQVSYLCQDNKNIQASFYSGPAPSIKPGEPPVPVGKVEIILSDGRNLILPQTIAADGARYANSDESFVFWSKGNGAFVLENNSESYQNCVMAAKDSGNLANVYLDLQGNFSIRYPADYTVDASYQYQGFGPNKEISGVKFIIPKTLAEGTNLSSYDSGISIETIPNAETCSANLFLDGDVDAKTITDDREYSFASRTEGAAGNFYEEQVWALAGSNPCLGVRYFIHSTNIDNYPVGAVQEFNRDNLLQQFDQIRRSLVIK